MRQRDDSVLSGKVVPGEVLAMSSRMTKRKVQQVSVVTLTDSKSSDGLHSSLLTRQEGGEREEVRRSPPVNKMQQQKRPSI